MEYNDNIGVHHISIAEFAKNIELESGNQLGERVQMQRDQLSCFVRLIFYMFF